MLTRSASKKKAVSPAKSVAKREETLVNGVKDTQETVSREAEIKSSASKKGVNSTRKSKIHEKDDVADLRTRRSLKFQEDTEPKSATKSVGRTRKSLKELPDNDVTLTPKSTRMQTLRREVMESMERKKRKGDGVGDTPKTSKTPKKLAESSESDGNEVGLSSSKSKRGRKPKKKDETDSNEMVEEEPESTPRKKGSRRKTSHEEDSEPEVESSPKSRKMSPMKQQTEKEDATESNKKAMEEVSSPLKKKKEAAERLRAEEGQTVGVPHAAVRENLTVTSSSKKSKSPVTPRTVETPVQSTPKKKSPKPGKSPVVPQVLIESINTEADSPTKQHTAELPEKEGADDSTPEESEEVAMSSPKRGRSISPKKRQKRQVEEPETTEDSEPEEVTTPPKQSKKKSPEKILEQEDSESQDSDIGSVSSPKQIKSPKKSKSPKKRGKEHEPEEKDVEMSMLSPKRQKSVTPKKQQEQQSEEKESVSEKYMCNVSPRKQKMMNRTERHKDVEVFLQDSEAIEMCSSPKIQKTKSPKKALVEENASQVEPCQKKKKSKKNDNQEDVEMTIPKLQEDLLASISSQKTSISVTDNSDSQKKKRKHKDQVLKSFLAEEEGYIPLEVGGATKFGVVGLDKFKTCTRHPAFDLKRDLLYGSRVKRIPYSQLQSYKMKVASKAMRI